MREVLELVSEVFETSDVVELCEKLQSREWVAINAYFRRGNLFSVSEKFQKWHGEAQHGNG